MGFLGTALASGSVGGDDVLDLIVGEPGHSDNNGRASVYSGLTGNRLFEVIGSGGNAMLGASVGGSSNINGDGLDDVVLGMPGRRRSLVLVTSYCGEPIESYGTGCPGTGGIIPQLSFSGCPILGTIASVEIMQGRGAAPGLLVLGFGGRASLPFLGCLFHVGPPFLLIEFVLGGPTGGPGDGDVSIDFEIPWDPGFSGVQVNLQAIIFDFAGPGGVVTTTNGLELITG